MLARSLGRRGVACERSMTAISRVRGQNVPCTRDNDGAVGGPRSESPARQVSIAPPRSTSRLLGRCWHVAQVVCTRTRMHTRDQRSRTETPFGSRRKSTERKPDGRRLLPNLNRTRVTDGLLSRFFVSQPVHSTSITHDDIQHV